MTFPLRWQSRQRGLPPAGLAILTLAFVAAVLQSRNRLPFSVPEGVYVGVSIGAALLVAQSLTDSTWETVAVFAVGGLSWAIGHETGQIDHER
ncbi:hypothetical protein KI388_11740 [Halorubrum sp. 2020YC2]|nr:hypothetical protein KI388_11740 [Halorubrum sp. 2020YC2]